MKFSQKLRKVFIHVDFLRQPYEFKVNYNEKNGTPLGGVLSVFLGMILLFYFVINWITIFEDSENQLLLAPTQYLSEKSQITEQQLNIALQIIQYSNEQENTLIDFMSIEEINSTFDINIFTLEQTILKDKQEQLFQIKETQQLSRFSCRNNTFYKEFILNSQELQNSICLNSQFSILGNQLADEQYKQMVININQVNINNQTNQNITYEARLLVQRNYISDFSQDEQIYDMQQGYKQIQVPIVRSNNVKNILLMEKFELELKQNLYTKVFSAPMNDKDLLKHGIRIQSVQQLQKIKNDHILTFEITLDNKLQKYFFQKGQNFMKFLDILSSTGGLFATIFTLLSFVYKYYQRHKIYEHLMNQTFLFDLGQDTKKFNLDIEIARQEQQRQFENPLLKPFVHIIRYGYPQYLYLKFFGKLKKLFKLKKDVPNDIQVFHNTKLKLQQDLDLTHLVKKLYELDKLKLLLLNKDQLVLFNTLVTPIIQVEHEMQCIEQKQNQSKQNTLQESQIQSSEFEPQRIDPQKRMSRYENLFYKSIIIFLYFILINNIFTYSRSNSRKSTSKQPIQQSSHKPDVIQFNSQFFQSNQQEATAENLLETYFRVKNDDNLYQEAIQSLDLVSKKDLQSNNHQKLIEYHKCQQNIQERVLSCKSINSRLISLIQSNKCIHNMVNFQEQMFQTQLAKEQSCNGKSKSNHKQHSLTKGINNILQKGYNQVFQKCENPEQNQFTLAILDEVKKTYADKQMVSPSQELLQVIGEVSQEILKEESNCIDSQFSKNRKSSINRNNIIQQQSMLQDIGIQDIHDQKSFLPKQGTLSRFRTQTQTGLYEIEKDEEQDIIEQDQIDEKIIYNFNKFESFKINEKFLTDQGIQDINTQRSANNQSENFSNQNKREKQEEI